MTCGWVETFLLHCRVTSCLHYQQFSSYITSMTIITPQDWTYYTYWRQFGKYGWRHLRSNLLECRIIDEKEMPIESYCHRALFPKFWRIYWFNPNWEMSSWQWKHRLLDLWTFLVLDLGELWELWQTNWEINSDKETCLSELESHFGVASTSSEENVSNELQFWT